MSSSFEGLPTALVNGVSLAYREQGTGEPVVFVHGSASDLRTWERQLSAIGSSYRAIAYSRRYARPNIDIEPDVDDQMLAHVDDLVRFLRSIDLPSVHLIGNSWGGFISLLTAIRYPQLVRSLVLMEPPVLSLFASTSPRPLELLSLLLHRPATALAIIWFVITVSAPAQKAFRRGDDETAMRTFGCGVLGKASYEQLTDARKQQMYDNLKAVRAQLLGAGFPPLNDGEVRSVRAATLLLVGEHSPTLLRQLTGRLHKILETSELVEIINASHLMHEDNATIVNKTILDFLKRQSSPS